MSKKKRRRKRNNTKKKMYAPLGEREKIKNGADD